jgi:hypothetical protein
VYRIPLLLFVAVASLSCATANARDGEEPGALYTGTLGKQAIVLELDAPAAGAADDGISGRYFYRRHHGDLLLHGTGEGNHLHLLEGRDPDDGDSPRLELTRAGDGRLEGTWQASKGHPLPVVLQPAVAPPVPQDAAPYLRQLVHDDPYESMRLSGLALQPGRRQRFMGHALQWWRQPDANIELFQVVDGYPGPARDRINAVLMDRLWSEVSAYYDCMATTGPLGGDYTQTVTPRLLSPSLVSISVFTEYYCGGAHPDFGDAPINLDARDARALTLEDVLWVGKGHPFRYTDDLEQDPAQPPAATAGDASFDTFSDYREKFLAPWLAARLAALYPSHVAGDGDDECGYDDPSVWQFVNWYLTPDGVFLMPSFPRFARVCETNDDWSLLPYAEVKKHPGGAVLSLP